MIVDKPMKDGIVLTEEMLAQMNRKLSPEELPDPNVIAHKVYEILEYMSSDEMINIQIKNFAEYQKRMEMQFPDFSTRYSALFDQIITGDNLEILFTMLESIEQIKSGNIDQADAEENIKKDLEERYIKPNVSENTKK